MSDGAVQLSALALIRGLSGLVMRRGPPTARQRDHRGRVPWFQGSCGGRAGRPIPRSVPWGGTDTAGHGLLIGNQGHDCQRSKGMPKGRRPRCGA
jgi:hypothetical protein